MIRGLLVAAGAVLFTVALQGCGEGTQRQDIPSVDTSNTLTMSLMEVAHRTQGAPSFLAAMRRTGLAARLEEEGPYTLFLPSRAPRFGYMYRADSVAENARRDSLRMLLDLHLVRGRTQPSGIGDSIRVSSVAEIPLTLRRHGQNAYSVEEIDITRTIQAQNGTVHLILRPLRLPAPDTARFEQSAPDSPQS